MKLTETQNKASEELQTNANIEDNLDYSELIKKHEVENTPFTIIEEEDKGSYVVLGKYRLSEAFETLEEAKEDSKRVDWERMMQVMGVMIEELNNK